MIDRYPTLPGVRLDGDDGQAIDLDGRFGRRVNSRQTRGPLPEPTVSLWTRDSFDNELCLFLTRSDAVALRDGLTRLLVADGVERYVQVPVKG